MNSETLSELTNAFRQIKNICENVIYRIETMNSHSFPQYKAHAEQAHQNAFKRQLPERYENMLKTEVRETNTAPKPEAPKKRIRNRKSKKPKAPMTPYFLFFNAKREFIHSKYPHLNQAEMANVAGQVWRSLQPQQKQEYERQYRANKARYAIEIKQFYEMYPEEMSVKQVKKSKAKSEKNFSTTQGENFTELSKHQGEIENGDLDSEGIDDIRSEISI